MNKRFLILFIILSFFSFSASAEEENPQDPWQGFNRSIFTFNETLDEYVARPIAVGYRFITPQPVDDGISNFFANLGDVLVVVNDVLQLKFVQALSDTARVTVNSTIGLFGFMDVATHIGLAKHEEDFGQTLGYWGVGSGPYLMLPLLGPSTLRDAFGLGVDTVSGLSYSSIVEPQSQQWGLFVLKNLDSRADLIPSEGLITGERYSFIRSFYLQRRQYLINDGVVEDEFEDDDFEDDFEDEEDF